MGRRKDDSARVLGPTWLPSREQWRVTVIAPQANGGTGRRSARFFSLEEEAREFADAVAGRIRRFDATTIEQAITLYDAHLVELGDLEVSRREVIRRLRLFFPSLSMAVSRITPERASGYYAAFRRRLGPTGKLISVSYHRAALINARSFCKWCVAKEWLPSNPFAAVEGVGRRAVGKEQLTGDEIRRFYSHALERAIAGHHGATASLMALLMALRSSDITRRTVRDLDLGGTVLRVSSGKTIKSNRPRTIPAVLRPLLGSIAAARQPHEPLFPTPYTSSGHHTRRWLEQVVEELCRGAEVPRITPHALKGMAGTVLAETGELADRIADHLSHESTAITRRHYVAPGALEDAQVARAFEVIAGGRGK